MSRKFLFESGNCSYLIANDEISDTFCINENITLLSNCHKFFKHFVSTNCLSLFQLRSFYLFVLIAQEQVEYKALRILNHNSALIRQDKKKLCIKGPTIHLQQMLFFFITSFCSAKVGATTCKSDFFSPINSSKKDKPLQLI